MDKKKLAMVITRMDWGGSPDIVRIICERLDKEKYDVRLICGLTRHPSQKTRNFFHSLGKRLATVSCLRRNINPIFDMCAFVQLYLLFKRERFALIHTHTAKAGFLGRIAARLAGIPVVIHTSHGHNFYGYFNPWLSGIIVKLERFASRMTDKILTLTELERNDLLRFHAAKQAQIAIVSTAVELDSAAKADEGRFLSLKQEFGIHKGDAVVGMVGRLEPIKGAEFFIAAAVAVAEKLKDTKFIVVGEGSLRRKLIMQVSKANLSQRFIFAGWRNDVANIISIMDVLVLASLNEAVGLVLIEAQGLGVPVIATNVGGVPEVIENGRTGILVSPQNAEELAKAMELLVMNEDKRKEMSQNARRRVKDHYNPEDFVRKISAVYKQTTEMRNR